jgi:hypothetical protein
MVPDTFSTPFRVNSQPVSCLTPEGVMAKQFVNKSCFLLALGALALAPVAALAQPPVASDFMSETDTATGVTEFRRVYEGASESASLSFGPTNGGMIGHPTILLEPDGSISDAFGLDAGFHFTSLSDDDPGGLSLASIQGTFGGDPRTTYRFLPETAGSIQGSLAVFDATEYMQPGSGFTASFASDVEASVPEPVETVSLLGMGAVGLLGFVRRWRKA